MMKADKNTLFLFTLVVASKLSEGYCAQHCRIEPPPTTSQYTSNFSLADPLCPQIEFILTGTGTHF